MDFDMVKLFEPTVVNGVLSFGGRYGNGKEHITMIYENYFLTTGETSFATLSTSRYFGPDNHYLLKQFFDERGGFFLVEFYSLSNSHPPKLLKSIDNVNVIESDTGLIKEIFSQTIGCSPLNENLNPIVKLLLEGSFNK